MQVLDLESAGNASLGSNGKVVVTVSLGDDDQVLATAHAAEVAAITLVRSTGTSDDGADSYAPDDPAAPTAAAGPTATSGPAS